MISGEKKEYKSKFECSEFEVVAWYFRDLWEGGLTWVWMSDVNENVKTQLNCHWK